MWTKWKRYILFCCCSSFTILLLLSGCATAEPSDCRLPCQLGIHQTEQLVVQDLLDALTEKGWIQDNPQRNFRAVYAQDAFSNVLETTLLIELSGDSPEFYGSELQLYIGYLGSVEIDHESVPLDELRGIRVFPRMTILESLALYGFPEGGEVFPFYTTDDLERPNPCPDRSHYIAYYDGGQTIIRAEVRQPIILNMWTAPIEIVYPFDEDRRFYSLWIGRYERMDHDPCR